MNHREEYDKFVRNMSESNNAQKLRKMKVLSNYVGLLAQEVSDDLQFGVAPSRASNDELN
ncbi:MAG: hypothetical protein WBA74_10750 [Cyclobacteriaceae bacterium]